MRHDDPRLACIAAAVTRKALASLYLLLAVVVAVAATGCSDSTPAASIANASPERGKTLIQGYGCTACHTIPGIPDYGSNVGPPLHKMAVRSYVGGVIPNTPDNLVRWLMNPPAIDPRTAMPALGVSETDATDIAAYLYTLE